MGTFGKTSIGVSPFSDTPTEKIGTNYQMANVVDQRLKSIWIYCSSIGSNIKVAAYSSPSQTGAPTSLAWGSGEFTPAVGWNEIVIPEASRPPLTASAWYWLGFKVAGISTVFRYDDGAANSQKTRGESYSNAWSDPFGTPTSGSAQFSIYGEYEVAAQTYTQTVTETMGLSDSIVTARILTKAVSETMGLSDSIAKQTKFGKVVSETMGLSDSITPAWVTAQEVSESMAMNDRIGISVNDDPSPSDRPDYTLPVSIEAVQIESLPINVVAQTIGSLSIKIVGQVGNVDVNIAAQAGNVNVNIEAQTVDITILTPSGHKAVIGSGFLTRKYYHENVAGAQASPTTLIDVDGEGRLENIAAEIYQTGGTVAGTHEVAFNIYVDGESSPSLIMPLLAICYLGGNKAMWEWSNSAKNPEPYTVNPDGGVTYISNADGLARARWFLFWLPKVEFTTHIKVVMTYPVGDSGGWSSWVCVEYGFYP